MKILKSKLLLTALLLISMNVSAAQISSVPNAQPVNKSPISQKSILAFAYEAILLSAYNYSFVNYESQFKSAAQYFTTDAWQSFKKTLNPSVVKDKLMVSAVTTRPPVILKEGIKRGKYTWEVEMPILVIYENGTGVTHEPLILTMNIIQTSQGLAIEKIVVVPQPPLP